MKKQRGFSAVEGLLIFVIVGLIGFVGWYVYQAKNNTNKSYSNAAASSNTASQSNKTTSGLKPGSTIKPASPASSSSSSSGSGQSKPSQVSTTATLTGNVTEGPMRPVCSANVSGCYVPVANHTLRAQDSTGNIVASTTTDSNGNFTFHLAPGHYTLILDPKVGVGPLDNSSVDVVAGNNTVNLVAETGIV